MKTWATDCKHAACCVGLGRARSLAIEGKQSFAQDAQEHVHPAAKHLQLSPPLHRLQHGDFVGVLDVAADGDAHGDAGYFHAVALELLGEIRGSSFAFDGGIGGDDDLVDSAAVDARDEVRDSQLLRADAVQRRDCAMQDVEDAIEVLGLFDGGNVSWLFDHTDQALVASRAGAVGAWVDVGDVVAQRAQAQVSLKVADGGGQGVCVVVARSQDVKGEALRALGAHSGQLLEFVDQPRHRLCEFSHREWSDLGNTSCGK